MTEIDLNNWNRKEHFNFFCKMDDPFHGIVQNLDATIAYKYCKTNKISFFSYYLHCTLRAVNEIENFKYRIVEKKPVIFEKVDASATILRNDKTFGFSYMKYNSDFDAFNTDLKIEIDRLQNTKGLLTRTDFKENIIHFSSIPWINFTGLTHARFFNSPDSCPKISIGKLTEKNGQFEFPVAVNVHHGLVDGYHLGLFFNKLQEILDQ